MPIDNPFREEAVELVNESIQAETGKAALDDIDGELKGILKQISNKGLDTKTAQNIAFVIADSASRELFLKQKLEWLGTMSRKLAQFDWSLFPGLMAQLEAASDVEQDILKQYVNREHAKLYKRYNAARLTEEAMRQTAEFEEEVAKAIIAIGRSDAQAVRERLKRALAVNVGIRSLIDVTLQYERKLLAITMRKLNKFNDQK